jgi:hypothetical protein
LRARWAAKTGATTHEKPNETLQTPNETLDETMQVIDFKQ